MKRIAFLFIGLGIIGNLCASDVPRFQLRYKGGVVHLGKVDEEDLLANLDDFLLSMPCVPKRGQSLRNFENNLIHELFMTFPTFTFDGRAGSSLPLLFRKEAGKPDVYWIVNCKNERTMRGRIAGAVLAFCRVRWNGAARERDAQKRL